MEYREAVVKDGVLDSFDTNIIEQDMYLVKSHNDILSEADRETISYEIKNNPQVDIFLFPKVYGQTRGRKKGILTVPFSCSEDRENGIISEDDANYLHAFFIEGLVIRGRYLKTFLSLKKESRLAYLFYVQTECARRQAVYYINHVSYELENSYEGDITYFPMVYERDWYEDMIENIIRAFTGKLDVPASNIGELLMYHAVFLAKFMIEANRDNVNKHLFEGEAAENILWEIGRMLSYVTDEILLDTKGYHIDMKNEDCITWVLLILKYKNNQLEFSFDGDRYGYAGHMINSLSTPTADIQFMDYEEAEDGILLTIDGRLSPILLMNHAEFGVMAGGKFVPAVYNGRYAHTKAFGTSVFKLHSFSFQIKLNYGEQQKLAFVIRYQDFRKLAPVTIEFQFHFSRLCDSFPHSYWRINKRLMMYKEKEHAILVKPVKPFSICKRELALWKDMISTRKKVVIKYIAARMLMLAKPVLKHKPIWLFYDKIYKAGDSAEYLYRYSLTKEDGIKKYYLVDGKSPDYERMKKAGLKPVKRRSLLHRYAFLYADMVIVSNSTVYAFNDLGLVDSARIRDLVDFHVVCVQHGMSVQKIAIAQNRLRDNTRLYFCASKYEIENLSKPVYDYAGRNVLRLTGVPRYDGLVNDDKRQILLSPTWRMQAAVPVKTNEGVARDYNPLFQETSYYRVYNSLINDARLIDAAKKYGYKLVYVLHPIVSPQIDDFETNSQVEIIPSVETRGHAGVDYEKVFRESSLMVTDFSGVQFDFAYMRKPVVYLHHEDIPEHYEEGTFFYDTMGFGEICHNNQELIDTLVEYMKNNCEMKPEYQKRVDDFFAFKDHKNCERIYQEMIEYQTTRIKK